jgi:hypothetical protein
MCARKNMFYVNPLCIFKLRALPKSKTKQAYNEHKLNFPRFFSKHFKN